MQKIISGPEGYKKLGELLANSKKTLVVCGSSLHNPPLDDYLKELPHVRFNGFSPNPSYQEVVAGVELFAQERCDAIFAVGGGSAIDVAKCIKLFCRMKPEQCFLDQPYCDTGIPLIAMPTTAGTGSESTHFAVIYFQGEKKSVAHGSLLPNAAILDPSPLKTLPLYIKKCTALDALCHGIESWWARRATPASRQLSAQAVASIRGCLQAYLAGEEGAAEQMLLASNLAGQAINITTTTAPHAMSYKLTSLYNLPHGHAVALCLPGVWRYLLAHPEHCVEPVGAEKLSQVLAEIAHAFGEEVPEKGPQAFDALLNKLDMETPKEWSSKDLELLASSVNAERLKNSPVMLDTDVLREIYREIICGRGA